MSPPTERTGGFLPIEGYAAIGDRHTAALVGADGSVDWLCLPSFDGNFVLGRLLDADRGGFFTLAPVLPGTVERRYLPSTNVLETTWTTATGRVRVTDALTLAKEPREVRELLRRVEAVEGEVEVEWRVEPRFAHTERPSRLDRRDGAVVARLDGDAVVVQSWDMGDLEIGDGAVSARVTLSAGGSGVVVLSAAPVARGALPFTTRDAAEARLAHTERWWREWTEARSYNGPWREAVLRSGLVLALLTFAPSGAVAAAPTTGLPEAIGGPRNWDYRFSWLRDSSFAMDALLRLGDADAARAFLGWLERAAGSPPLQPFYRLDASSGIGQTELDISGYRGSRPVRAGNGAVSQRQLGNYGDLLQAVTLYAEDGHDLGEDLAAGLARIADHVCDAWPERDSGLWELGAHRHYTTSKMLCWVALDRAGKLAREGKIPGEGADRWAENGERLRSFVEERCWSEERGSYTQAADGEELDAGVLLGVFFDYPPTDDDRFDQTIDAVRGELGRGPLLYRYSGMDRREGAFLACSFWLAHALARRGRLAEAERLMDELVPLANDVGLFSEEMDPATGAMLGNFPQALTHLALVNAAVTIAERR